MKKHNQTSSFSVLSQAIYEDKRIHLVFSDKSSIIVHDNNSSFTYFHSDGKKYKFSLQNIPRMFKIQ